MTAKREESWRLRRGSRPYATMAWLCMRNFNEVIQQDEKHGVVFKPYNQMEGLRETIKDC